MNPLFDTYLPDGFSTVNGYLFVEDPPALLDFLKQAFYGREIDRTEDEETGEIRNVIVKIGHACIMLSQARGQFLGMSTCYYLFTSDVDALHNRALGHGATEVFPPADMEYGDRQSGIQDPAGNYWWISKRLVESQYGGDMP